MANKLSKSYLLEAPEALAKEKVRLRQQAQILFALEEPCIREFMSDRLNSLRILDLGCGNGSFLNLFLSKFPSAIVLGFERNQSLIDDAAQLYPDIQIISGDLLDQGGVRSAIEMHHPNLILLRFVLQHLSPIGRLEILKTIRNSLKSDTRLLIFEPDDSEIRLTQSHALLECLIDRTIKIQRERGGDRTVARLLENELKDAGFKSIQKRPYVLSNKSVGLDGILKVIFPIWNSLRSEAEKNELEDRLLSAKQALITNCSDPNFEISFPLYSFCAW